MGRYKVIHQNTAWLGQWMYRATSNGLDVHLQELNVRFSTWRTIRTVRFSEWAKWAESVELGNPYNDNLATFRDFVLDQ
jgi:hypothetical protein